MIEFTLHLPSFIAGAVAAVAAVVVATAFLSSM